MEDGVVDAALTTAYNFHSVNKNGAIMKIERIEVKNFLGLRHLAIDVEAPVLLVCGPNGAGKSSLIEAVRFALTGETPRAALKKDFPTLLSAGQTAGVVSVTADGQQITRNVKTGAGAGAPDDLGALAYTLDAPRLARMDAKERRAALFGIMGVSFSSTTIERELIDRGHMVDHVERIMPVLKGGFDAAATEAKKLAAESRGAWKEVTGETYGAVKAETWAAPIPSRPRYDADDVAAHRAAYEAAVAHAAALESRKSAAEQAAISEHRLRDRAKPAAKLRSDLAKIESAQAEALNAINADAEAEIAGLRAGLESAIAEAAALESSRAAAERAAATESKLRERAAKLDLLRAELEKAEAARGQTRIGNCPECGAELATEDGDLVVATPGLIDAPDQADLSDLRRRLLDAENAQAALAELPTIQTPAEAEILKARESVAALRVKLDSVQDAHRAAKSKVAAMSAEAESIIRELRDAEQAQAALDELAERKIPQAPDDDEIREARYWVDVARDGLAQAEEACRAYDEAKRAAQNAATATARAAELNSQVAAWTAMEMALSPSGLPAELLARALGPLNKSLDRVHAESNWPRVRVEDDIAITADGRAYGLLSESERWRVDTALAYAAAGVSGCGLVLLDRFDVLDVRSRSQFIRLALAMDAQTIAAGTLKEAPGSMPGKLQSVWMGG